jgi:gliding motility-associated-like protein
MPERYFLKHICKEPLRKLGLFICFLCFVPYLLCSQTNVAPEVNATGDQIYCPLTSIRVATAFTITDPDDTEIDAFYIQISTGYERALDTLRLENNHPNVEATWNSQEGKLTLTGVSGSAVAYVDLIAAVSDVVFESSSTSPTEEKFFSFTIGSANYLPETGHYYEYIEAFGIRWDDARAAAENRSFFGLQGYLATITSDAEAQLTGEQASGTGWIGGTDSVNEGVWRWATGPEAGTIFWNGDANGTSPNFAFWNTNEPNNLNDEDYAHITAPGVGITGSWNDLSITGDPTGDYQPKGYIVEYGGMPGDPTLTLSASTKITTPKIFTANPAVICGAGTITLSAESTLGEVVWFDEPTGGMPLATGNVFTADITSSTTFYAIASYDGCLNGERIPVDAQVQIKPQVNSDFTVANCGSGQEVLFNLSRYNDLIIDDSNSYTITFHLSENDAENNINPLDDEMFSISTADEVFFRVEGTGDLCYSVGRIFLEESTTSLPANYVFEQEKCDEGAMDGIASFDLQEASDAILSEFPLNQNLSVSFYVSEGDAYLSRNAISQSDNYTNATPFAETLFVRVEDSTSGTCFGVGPNVLLRVNPIPSFSVQEDYIYCTGESVLVEPFAANGDYTYEWFNEEGQVVGTAARIRISQQGMYSVIATSESGCVGERQSFQVTESGPLALSPQFIQVEDDGETGTIIVNHQDGQLGIGEYVFALDDPNNMQEEGVFTNVTPGLHTLYAMDLNGCGMDEISVGVIGVSKFLTPNNDGINDTVKILGVTTTFYEQGTFYVFDRYGRLLAQTNPLVAGWNGFFDGQPMPPSDYWYTLELRDVNGKVHFKKGHFTLKQ